MTDEHDNAKRPVPEPTPDPAAPDRRQVLKRAAYVAPAIVGTLLISRAALAQASCTPQACGPVTTPCNPDTLPCSPATTPCGPASCKPRG